MIYQETQVFFIINNIIYKCIKHNEHNHYLLDITKQPTKLNFTSITWDLYWNLERLTLVKAIEYIMKSPDTMYNKRYYKIKEANRTKHDGLTLGDRYKSDLKVRRMNWALSA